MNKKKIIPIVVIMAVLIGGLALYQYGPCNLWPCDEEKIEEPKGKVPEEWVKKVDDFKIKGFLTKESPQAFQELKMDIQIANQQNNLSSGEALATVELLEMGYAEIINKSFVANAGNIWCSRDKTTYLNEMDKVKGNSTCKDILSASIEKINNLQQASANINQAEAFLTMLFDETRYNSLMSDINRHLGNTDVANCSTMQQKLSELSNSLQKFNYFYQDLQPEISTYLGNMQDETAKESLKYKLENNSDTQNYRFFDNLYNQLATSNY